MLVGIKKKLITKQQETKSNSLFLHHDNAIKAARCRRSAQAVVFKDFLSRRCCIRSRIDVEVGWHQPLLVVVIVGAWRGEWIRILQRHTTYNSHLYVNTTTIIIAVSSVDDCTRDEKWGCMNHERLCNSSFKGLRTNRNGNTKPKNAIMKGKDLTVVADDANIYRQFIYFIALTRVYANVTLFNCKVKYITKPITSTIQLFGNHLWWSLYLLVNERRGFFLRLSRLKKNRPKVVPCGTPCLSLSKIQWHTHGAQQWWYLPRRGALCHANLV